MAKPKSPGADKFRVGQQCVLVMPEWTGWQRINGEFCVVVEPKRRMDIWCSNIDGSNRNLKRGEERYYVKWNGGILGVRECHLRAIYDDEKLSTWEKFAKKTGIDITAPVRAVRKRKSVA